MINVDDLLQPIAGDKPCGEDFTYHPSFQNLETMARGKPDSQFGPGEEPNWKEVRDAAIEVLGQSKHLMAGVILTTSLLKLGGVEGFRDGLAVVRGLTEKFWGDVYPKLDPDDNNDPTERLNILKNLSSGKFTVYLNEIVLCNSPAMGRVTLQQILMAKDKGKAEAAGATPGSNAGPDLTQIKAAFRDAGPAAAAATLAMVNEAAGHAQGIENFLEATLGAGQGVSFETLDKMLVEMKHAIGPFAGGSAPAAQESGSAAASGGGAARSQGEAGMSGAIQNTDDVIRALDMICEYYRQNEPSSPVPLILQRAQRLVAKNFMEILTDLTPGAMTQLEIITGTKPSAPAE
jgi:type VI secretion system protein ImpA